MRLIRNMVFPVSVSAPEGVGEAQSSLRAEVVTEGKFIRELWDKDR